MLKFPTTKKRLKHKKFENVIPLRGYFLKGRNSHSLLRGVFFKKENYGEKYC